MYAGWQILGAFYLEVIGHWASRIGNWELVINYELFTLTNNQYQSR
jgi:hypothetical protein